MHLGFFPGFTEMLMILFLGGGIGLPLGIPPGPEDPVVSRVAPEECFFYLSWNGMAKPDPASRNQAEQLLAEKEVQECLTELETRLLDWARREAERDPQAAAMVEPIATVLKAVLTNPAAAFVSKFDPDGGERSLRGGALVHLGEQAKEVEQALAKIEKALAEGDAKTPAGPQPWHRFPLGFEGPVAEWAVKGKYLIIGVGDGEADKIVARARQNAPAWLSQIRQQVAVPRPASLVYVNVAGIVNAVGPMPSEVRSVLEALGLTRVQSVVNVAGLDDTGCISKTQIAVDGELKGLLSLFTGEPLAKEHLAVIPKDATLAAAARFDLAKVYKEVIEGVGRVEPQARDMLLSGVGEFEERLKIKLAKDIFESIGDVWRVYNSPSEGGLVITGLTAVVNLRDHDRLVAANGKLVVSALLGGAAKQMTVRGRAEGGPRISQFRFGDQTVFFLNFAGDFVPFAPAWCITDKELIVALFPQNIKAYLSRAAADGSLADVPAAAGLFAGQDAPLAVAYCDTPGLFKLVYPIAQMIVQAACSGLQREGAPIDISLLPSALAIGRHLQPTVTGVRRTRAGIVVETRQTLPAGGGGLALSAFVVGGFARLSSGPGTFPTAQNTSTNNLKNIVLGLHNYHDVYKFFPAAAGPQKPGQPPVSWRVLILPFVEGQALYDQYRFDEPWDSENNKKVAAQMPPCFKAPGSKVAAEGKTNYLGVVGDDYAFAATKGRSLANFLDGTSNTIIVVEVSDEKAVPWTKPEDFTPDKKNPIAGLVALRPGRFLAAFADGSVQRLSAGIDAATLNALFTRAGGEAVRVPNE